MECWLARGNRALLCAGLLLLSILIAQANVDAYNMLLQQGKVAGFMNAVGACEHIFKMDVPETYSR